jgi:adapter protein MecA 1/2
VPLSTDSIMLIITKIDNREELESKFTSLPNPDSRKFIKRLTGDIESEISDDTIEIPVIEDESENPAGIKAFFVYKFTEFNNVTIVASKLIDFSIDNSMLYKNHQDGLFYLVLLANEMDRREAKIVRGLLAEYADQVITKKTIISHYDEHFDVIIKNNALKILVSI